MAIRTLFIAPSRSMYLQLIAKPQLILDHQRCTAGAQRGNARNVGHLDQAALAIFAFVRLQARRLCIHIRPYVTHHTSGHFKSTSETKESHYGGPTGPEGDGRLHQLAETVPKVRQMTFFTAGP